MKFKVEWKEGYPETKPKIVSFDELKQDHWNLDAYGEDIIGDLFTDHHLGSEVVFSIVKDTEEDADVCLKYESSTYNDDEDALEINLSIEGGIVYET